MFPQPSTNYRYTFYYNYDECSTFNLYNFDTSFKTDKYSYGLELLVSLFVLTLSKISFVRTACHFLDIKLLVQCYLRHHKCSSSTTIGLWCPYWQHTITLCRPSDFGMAIRHWGLTYVQNLNDICIAIESVFLACWKKCFIYTCVQLKLRIYMYIKPRRITG